jgi:predicted DCC family thiol-disulfide oxidoreductase YuxK
MNIILFDGVCNFCNATVNTIIKYDTHNHFKFAAQQSLAGKRILNELGYAVNTFDSVLLLKNNQVFTKTDAVIEVCKLLTGMPRIFIFIQYIPKPIRDFGYSIIAKYRYAIFGKRTECMLPSQANKDKFIVL